MPPTIHIPNRPLPGMQAAGFHQKFRVGTCEEADCEWFLNGRTGMDANAPFVHPAGVQCGDTSRCQPCRSPRQSGALCGNCEPCKSGTANCPCPSRVMARSTATGRRGHLVPDFQITPVLSHSNAVTRRDDVTEWDTRPVGVSEWVDRLHTGTDMIHRINTNGL